jgi:superfamily I DNA/RNA helicase
MGVLMTLSLQQQAVVDHMRASPHHLLVSSLAGTGKSTVLLSGVPYLEGTTVVTSFGKHICDELAQRAKREGLDCGVRTTHSVGMASILHSMQPFNRAPDPRKLNEIVRRMMREAGMVTLAENVRTVGKLVTRAKADLMQTEQDILSHLDDAPVYFVKERAKGGRRATIEYPPQDKVAQVAWAAVAECARDTGRFDYDDMLWFPVIFQLHLAQ